MNITGLACTELPEPEDDPVPHWLVVIRMADGRLFYRVRILLGGERPSLEEIASCIPEEPRTPWQPLPRDGAPTRRT